MTLLLHVLIYRKFEVWLLNNETIAVKHIILNSYTYTISFYHLQYTSFFYPYNAPCGFSIVRNSSGSHVLWAPTWRMPLFLLHLNGRKYCSFCIQIKWIRIQVKWIQVRWIRWMIRSWDAVLSYKRYDGQYSVSQRVVLMENQWLVLPQVGMFFFFIRSRSWENTSW